ncbi:BMP family lipoprotein [Naasia lichenicola]|uniref:BMP family ABC transporter substrate-binding protein n=1 Tax=Naasia lichenicola TaxID=2565933 RepID=A0A4V3WT69_9MICO|nr:BMP family ABC transporter substrate-binding protein [Naasia lichenicola]THG30867.1 BMP family ABC transporter substrate-binding protein [Naasia lichenicola]
MNSITRKRGLTGLVLVGASTLMLAACAAPPAADSSTAASGDSDYLACMVSDEGSFNDNSFNEAAKDGLDKAASELGIQTQALESSSTEDFGPNLQQLVDASCNVIFAVGFNFSDGSLEEIANANPDSDFVWIDADDISGFGDNLKPINYSMDQSSYLAGYLAASYSTTKVIGTYGGLDIPAVDVFMEGYYYGAKAYETDSGTPVTVLGAPVDGAGTFTDPATNFGDTAGAASITQSQLDAGADVVFPVAGGLFASSAQVITDSGKDAVIIGVDKDIAVTSPELAPIVLTSVEKRMTQAVFDVIEPLAGGEEFSNEPYIGTLENDGTALSDFGDFDSKISDDAKAKLDELKAGIIDGSIVPVPAS